MSIEDITIVITSFKSSDKINSCLDSISSKAKVIVVENSGSQKFKESVEKKYQNLQCIIPNDLQLVWNDASGSGHHRIK